MTLPNLSVVVITRDAATTIDACLASTAFADEWIVVDSGSGDDTRERARARGAAVFETDDWPGFGAQKQRALDRASGRWVLAIDADERVSPELAAEIGAVVAPVAGAEGTGSSSRPVAYELSRLSRYAGRWIRHGDWYPDRVVRLFRRDAARWSDDAVHERVLVDTRRGPIGRLDGDLLHDTMPTFADALRKLDRYSSDGAAAKAAAGATGGLGPALGHAGWAFFRSYVLKRGFLDGAAGFLVAAYIAEGSWWRQLKIAERARGLPAAR